MKRVVGGVLTMLVLVPIGAGAILSWRYRPAALREPPDVIAREIATLSAQRDSLRTATLQRVDSAPLFQRVPPGDVLIGVPTPFVTSIVRDLSTGWFHEIELRLRGLQVHKAGAIRKSLGLFGRRTLGDYDLDVTIDDVRGRLQPGVPTLSFGGDVVRVGLPVRLSGGSGVATIDFGWDSKGLANLACRDLAAKRRVAATVRSGDYTVRGRIVLSATDGAIIADPDFPALTVRVHVDPAPSALTALDSLVSAQGGMCGVALRRARVAERVRELVSRGFSVTIPQKFFRPLRLPVSVETAVPLQDRRVALTVSPTGLTVTPTAIWVGARVGVTREQQP